MDLITARALFPGLQDKVFLDAACISLMPRPADEALRRLSQDLLTCPARDASAHHIALDRTGEKAREEVARLIGASLADIALVESTTQGLQAIAAAVPLQRGDRILIGETEFLGLAVPWIPRARAEGVHLQVVPSRQGRLLVEDFAREIDAHTRMILLSSVQWSNGYRADLGKFSQLCQERGVLLVVDAIQQLGAIPLDVSKLALDFVVCGGHKWLNAPAGRGFLYVHPRQQQRRSAAAWGYLGIQEPSEGWADYFATPTIPAVRDYDFVHDARAFEVGGTANYPGNVVLAEAVHLINELGHERIAQHVLDLGEHLAEELARVGATVVSPAAREERSGILTFTLGRGPDHDRHLLHRLWAERIILSQRYTAGVGGLRTSLHFFNNQEDIARLIEVVSRR
jgi:cysteine desulfurase/selenocysteine lyase